MTFAEAIARLQGNPKLKFESIEELTNRYHVLRVSPSGFFYLDIYESKGGRLIYPDCGAGNFNGSVQIESDWKQIQEPVDFMTAINSNKCIKPVSGACKSRGFNTPSYWLEMISLDLGTINGLWVIE